jgi:hypothetical protein
MGISLEGRLVVAISSRALFDFEEENLVFEQTNDKAYMQLQLERLDTPAKPGVLFEPNSSKPMELKHSTCQAMEEITPFAKIWSTTAASLPSN